MALSANRLELRIADAFAREKSIPRHASLRWKTPSRGPVATMPRRKSCRNQRQDREMRLSRLCSSSALENDSQISLDMPERNPAAQVGDYIAEPCRRGIGRIAAQSPSSHVAKGARGRAHRQYLKYKDRIGDIVTARQAGEYGNVVVDLARRGDRAARRNAAARSLPQRRPRACLYL